jgi:glycerophosphoryl diester phosphodiesterase
VALQVPITYELGGQRVAVTTPESVLASHRAGYAVHVWLSGGEESRRVYDRLLDMCVDGIMAARPAALERRLRARDVVRPGGRGTDPCSVRATAVHGAGDAIGVALRRRGLGPQAHRGTVTLRTRGGTLLGRGPFSLRAGDRRGAASLRPTRAGGRLLHGDRARRVVAEVRTRGARGEPVSSRVTLLP